MAKKPVTKPKPKAKPKKDSAFVTSVKDVGGQYTEAGKIAAKLGLTKPLGTLDTSQYEVLADPNSAAFAGKRSEQLKSLLGMMEGGLAGLNATENQALREQAVGEINRNSELARQNVQNQLARSNVRGAAAARLAGNVDRDRGNQIADFEQKNLIDNIGIQDSRRAAYGNQLTGAEADEWTRAESARKGLQNQNEFNLGQEAAGQAANVAAISGIVQAGTSQNLGQQQINVAKGGGRSRTSSSSSSSSTSTTNSSGRTPQQQAAVDAYNANSAAAGRPDSAQIRSLRDRATTIRSRRVV